VDISPEPVSRVTDEVKGLTGESRNRPLEPFYPVIFFDILRVNIRDKGHAGRKAVYAVTELPGAAVRFDGQKKPFGMRIERNEGSKFCTSILNGLKNRGVKDILPAGTDELSGFPGTVNTVFPKAGVQLYTARMVRNSVKYMLSVQRPYGGNS
jgi:transposase-like protein